jgi:molybdopterin-containing oxidoreductase family iron-sulfur binding subunit
VKWVWKEAYERVFPERVTPYATAEAKERPTLVLCNHCDNPPCVRVCPTRATWKRDDGIVVMDQHRCIGCRYCMAACPYGSRSFNWQDPRPHLAALDPGYPTRTKGVVEKCTFCEERLAAGRPPACAEACKEKALVFGDTNDPAGDLRQLLGRQYSIRRRPELGTRPQVYYLVDGDTGGGGQEAAGGTRGSPAGPDAPVPDAL